MMNQRTLRYFLDSEGQGKHEGISTRTTSRKGRTRQTTPSIIDQLNDNNNHFEELLLCSEHALLNHDCLFRAVQHNTTVKSIRINGFFVEQLSIGNRRRLWETIGNLPTFQLEELHFMYFSRVPLQGEAVMSVVHGAKGLQKLYIHDCKIVFQHDNDSTVARQFSLEQHVALTTIHFTHLILPQVDNKLYSLDPLVKMIATAPGVKKVKIRTAHMQKNLLSKQAFDLLCQLTSLRSLHLPKVVVDNKNICDFIYRLGDIHGHESGRRIAAAAAAAAATTTTTTTDAAATSVSCCSNLKELALQWEDHLDRKTCVAIGQMLTKNKALEHLEIWGDTIDEDGLVVFTKALHKNRNLKVLWMSHQNITAKGRAAILEMLQHNVVLQSTILWSQEENNSHFLQTMDFWLQMNTTQIRRLLLNVNVNREQILDKLTVYSDNLNYLFHLLQGNPSFIEMSQ